MESTSFLVVRFACRFRLAFHAARVIRKYFFFLFFFVAVVVVLLPHCRYCSISSAKEMCVTSQTWSTVYAWGHALTSIISVCSPWFWNGIFHESLFHLCLCVSVCLCLCVCACVLLFIWLRVWVCIFHHLRSIAYLICVMYFQSAGEICNSESESKTFRVKKKIQTKK